MVERTTLECLKNLCETIVAVFFLDDWLRSPNEFETI